MIDTFKFTIEIKPSAEMQDLTAQMVRAVADLRDLLSGLQVSQKTPPKPRVDAPQRAAGGIGPVVSATVAELPCPGPATVATDRTVFPSVMGAREPRVFTTARKALLLEFWPTFTSVQDIKLQWDGLPGLPSSPALIAAYAKKLGLSRPAGFMARMAGEARPKPKVEVDWLTPDRLAELTRRVEAGEKRFVYWKALRELPGPPMPGSALVQARAKTLGLVKLPPAVLPVVVKPVAKSRLSDMARPAEISTPIVTDLESIRSRAAVWGIVADNERDLLTAVNEKAARVGHRLFAVASWP